MTDTSVSIVSGKYDDDFAGDESIPGQGTLVYVNEAGVSEGVMDAVKAHQDISNAIESWTRSLSGTQTPGAGATRRPNYDLFQRDRYTNVDNIFRTIELCSAAVENDDILSTLCDVSEGIAIQKMSFEMYDEDQQDVWNQIARDLDLDSRLREVWRELFKASQVYVAVEWDYRTYTVRTKPNPKEKRRLLKGNGAGRGNRNRKKEFRLFCPTGLSVLDPKKVVPVGNMMFGRERFAYIADKGEHAGITSALQGAVVDDMVMRLIERKYEPTASEKQSLGDMGIPTDRLWLFRQNAIFRHSLTRSQYERFAVPRLKSVLPLIDMKQHLREADRAALVGNTNFIVVIRKGSDKHPAKSKELEALHEQARVIARVPVIIGDHRLSVDIVAPPNDNTLDERRYNAIDARLVFRALGSFAPSSGGQSLGGSSSQVQEVSLVVSRGFENRRHQMARSFERAVFRVCVDGNEELTEVPSLAFTPRRITLDVNQDIVNAVLKLRDRGEISRGTALEELNYDQEVEAMRRVREEEDFDDIFLTHVPFDSPDNKPEGNGGNGGGNGNAPNDTEGGRPRGSRTAKKKGDA